MRHGRKNGMVLRALLGAVACLFATPVFAQSTAPQVPTDWDLFMLKLVNSARTDPATENQLRGTNYSNPAVPPLAYSPQLGRAAQNHNDWMSINASNPNINDPTNTGPAPDSFTHYETLNAQSRGTPATSSAGYTGVGTGTRISYSGYSWSGAGENIYWRSNTPTINTNLITSNHIGWWTSTGHRNNFMSANHADFGHHALNTFDHFATQNLARPGGSVRTYMLGVLYDDLDESGLWEPHNVSDPNREGLGEVPYYVYSSATGGQVGSASSTYDNGSFSFLAGDGTYDLKFQLDSGDFWVREVVVDGSNVDLGDLAIGEEATEMPGDFNDDGLVNLADYTVWRDNLGAADESLLNGNGDGTNGVDAGDYLVWKTHFGNTDSASIARANTMPVPEPAALATVLLALAIVAFLRPRTSWA